MKNDSYSVVRLNFFFCIVYTKRVCRFVDEFSDGPNPSTYSYDAEFVKTFRTKEQMNNFLEEIKGKYGVKTVRIFHAFNID